MKIRIEMTYYELIEALKECFLDEPNINWVGIKDIYELNSKPDIDYGIGYITQNPHTLREDTFVYSLNLFYIDRWDESEENQLLVHNKAYLALSNILNRFNDRYPEVAIRYNGTITPFYQRFKDLCCGAFLTIQIEVPRLYECYDYE